MQLTRGPSVRLTANGCKPSACSVSAVFLVCGDQISWETQQLLKRQVRQIYTWSLQRAGWRFLDMPDVWQKADQCTMPSKRQLKCLQASHQRWDESQEDHKTTGCTVFSVTCRSSHRRPGQQLIMVKCGECYGPLPDYLFWWWWWWWWCSILAFSFLFCFSFRFCFTAFQCSTVKRRRWSWWMLWCSQYRSWQHSSLSLFMSSHVVSTLNYQYQQRWHWQSTLEWA